MSAFQEQSYLPYVMVAVGIVITVVVVGVRFAVVFAGEETEQHISYLISSVVWLFA